MRRTLDGLPQDRREGAGLIGKRGKQMRVIRMKGRGTGCFVEICLKFVKICCIIVDQMIWIMTGVFWVSGYKVFAC